MQDNNHILISGDIGVGKSTLIRQLLLESGKSCCGFLTKRLPADEHGESATYLHAASISEEDRFYTQENRIGSCNNKHCTFQCPVAFDTYGVKLLSIKPGCILLMDELGFMENDALIFQHAVLKLLDSDTPVLAAIKNKRTPFLEAVRTHRNVQVYNLTIDNRDAIRRALLPLMRNLL
ncbi:MAG: nucleoside-triphosphatase [Clostridia bacterium]